MATILIVDDEPDIREVIRFALEGTGFRVLEAGHADEARKLMQSEEPDLILLDWMLPGRSGLELAQQLKQNPKSRAIPIIMVSARGEEEDRIRGLETGADDYIAKPFSPRELLARIRAVLRRKGETRGPSADERQPVLRFGSLEIDRDARTVQVAGQGCELTSYQFDLLVALAERAGRVLTRDQIMEAVRGRELEAFDRSIDVHMGRIRAAIEADPKTPRRILTVRGVGYVFAKQQD